METDQKTSAFHPINDPDLREYSSNLNVSVTDKPSVTAKFKYTVHGIRFLEHKSRQIINSWEILQGEYFDLDFFNSSAQYASTEFTELAIPSSILPASDFTVNSSNIRQLGVTKCSTNNGECVGVRITGIEAGNNTVLVPIGNVTKSLPVKVKPVVPAISLTIKPNYASAVEGQTFKVRGVFAPLNSTYTINWDNIASSIMTSLGNGKYTVKKLVNNERYSRVGVNANEDSSVKSYFDYAFYQMRFCRLSDYAVVYENGEFYFGGKSSFNLYFKKGDSNAVITDDILSVSDFTVVSADNSVVTVSIKTDDDVSAPYIYLKALKKGSSKITVTIGDVSRSFTAVVDK